VVPPQVRLAIYERDGWVCQLCHEPVDPDLDQSDVWGATLDHIECQSWALIPDHRPTNLRLAHRWCNSARGDERYPDAV
jgi:5-methylcytosine-specific restriction endonuclease McrA